MTYIAHIRNNDGNKEKDNARHLFFIEVLERIEHLDNANVVRPVIELHQRALTTGMPDESEWDAAGDAAWHAAGDAGRAAEWAAEAAADAAAWGTAGAAIKGATAWAAETATWALARDVSETF